MTKNFIELIKNKDYAGFTQRVSEELDTRAIDTFEKFEENTVNSLREGHSQSHDDLVNDNTGGGEFDEDGTETFTDEELDAFIDAEGFEEDVSLEDVIGVLMDEGVLTEEDLETVTEEDILEVSKALLGRYVKRATDSVVRTASGQAPWLGGHKKDANVWKRMKHIGKATDKLTKEEAEVAEGYVDTSPAASIVARYRKVIAADATANAVIAGNVDAPVNKTDETAEETKTRESKNPGSVSGPVSKGSSIVSKYRRSKGLDATSKAVVDGNADGDKNRQDETDDETKARESKNPGRVEGSEINAFKK